MEKHHLYSVHKQQIVLECVVEVTFLPADGRYPFIQYINQNQEIKWLHCFSSSRCEKIGRRLLHFSSDVTLVRIEDFVVPLNATASVRTPNQVNTRIQPVV